MSSDCPCGSGLRGLRCCVAIIEGDATARSAEALMRSRYTAFVLRDVDYLFRTWHPSTRPLALDLDLRQWIGLRVLEVNAGLELDLTGVVEFEARYLVGNRHGLLRERSNFVRHRRTWLYVDGQHS